ncbi:MAG TPA: DUF4082 domain-containing protein [Actinomycetes bacterium]|nr:DUF4082 domain-containing protein [Actinomycetes bacterium]
MINVPAAVAAPCDPPIANPIVCENSKPGNPPSEWDISGAGSSTIQGFATDISVDQGQTVQFKVDTPASAYRLDIYRMGYYGGQGARQITTVNPSASLPQNQPNCVTQPTTGLIDCGNWGVSASWSVPVDAVSGIYFARLVRTDGTAGSSHIFFVVRDDDGRSDILFQTSDTTWQAYNQYGGNSLYVGQPAGRAYKVSYNRPFTTRSTSNEDWLFNSEYPAVRFLEANGYNASYSTGVDTDRRGAELLEHKTFLSVGHDEYWSGQQRANVEAARDAGVNLAFLSGNEIFWKTRWENSIDGSGTSYRTLVTYKETHANAVIDPQDPPTWTGTWMDPRFSPPADGGRPQNRLSGQLFAVNCCTYQMQAGAADSALRLWRSTRVASLTGNQTTTLGDSLIGYEWDESPDNGFRPPGLIHLSSTTINADQVLTDFGTNYGPRTATHHLSLYRAPSGALVFGAGTVQWAWGLDDQHDRGTVATSDVAVKQATVNLLADMGVQPGTLQAGLVAATQTTDTTPPTSAITSPANGATVQVNQPLTISGTASDVGGVVGGVEVSVDGGTTWHPANGRTNWSYTFTPTANGQITIKTRATDDSARIETPGAGITVTVGSGPVSCPCTIWTSGDAPTNPADPDSAAVELGVKFRAAQDGVITGVRFYKGAGNIGTHVGNLWTSAGTPLATGTFSGETTTGWQQVNFASPVAITANTTYVASYYAPVGRYAADNGAFATSGVTRGPLTALQDGVSGGNGVYRYGTGGGFPNSSFQSSNYWVDVVFNTSAQDTTPPTVSAQTPAPGATAVSVGATVTATFNEDVQPATIAMELRGPGTTLVPSSVSYNAGTRTATLTPSAALATSTVYTVNLSGAKDAAGNTMTAVSWSFTTASGVSGCPCTVWPSTATPATAADPDSSSVELGVRFRADRDGYITGIRFYKGTGNTGTHIGNLWTNTGTNLATVVFSGETASGWQEASFSSAVPITANTTYVASYHAPVGRYSTNNSYFASAGTTNGPLTALQNGLDGANGVYLYGAGGFPTNTFQSTNYWVDVVFQTNAVDTTPPTLTARTPAVGASGVPTTTTVTATFSEPVQAPTIAVDLRDASNNAVPGAKTYDATSRTVTFTPSSQLATSATYTATVSGAKDTAGNTMAPVSWSFTTAAPPPPPPSDGPGGPIAVVTSSTNPYSQYFAEIMRAEGFNEFSTVDAGSLSAAALAPYDVAIVGEVSLTATQATTLSTWVNGGGNLIAMRPDSDLNALLGITTASGTVANGYIKIDTTTAPGAGITADTMQFHGTANRYTLSGAQTIAALYTNATSATTNPAVTLRSVGTSGGQAASFAYDLARSIAYTRQGNPAWAGQERDGISPRRSDDLYFGGAATDWVNLNKVAIPQADEQQRLLANLIEVMNRDRKPMPRFWYLPDSRKAVVVGTGDNHGTSGSAGRFNDLIAASPAGCSVANWQCLRYTTYMYPGSLTASAANSYAAQGFEIAAHTQNGCGNFTSPANLEATYAAELSDFQAAYPSLPPQRTNRFHCLVWSDWSSQPTTELAHGIRLDANYYYWPGTWIQDRPGFMTGSGFPMRFTNSTGGMIDVYQSATVMTDESQQTYPFTANTLLDNALGPLGYYGAFTANMHTDNASTFESDQLMASALARNVAIVSANQMLTWVDGRNGSSFGNLSYSGNTLTFSVAVGSGANGLTGMLPVAGPGGANLTALSRGGSPVSFTTTTIKGQAYGMFAAVGGSYTATYSTGGGALALSAAAIQPSSDGTSATIAWKSSTPASTAVVYDAAGPAPELVQAEATSSLNHSVTLDQLKPGRTYAYRLISVDNAGRSTTWPRRGQPAATFKTPAADTKAPTIGGIAVRSLPDGTAMVTWRTNEPATSRVTFGHSKTRLARLALDDKLVGQHAVVVTGLNANATYWFSVSSTDEAGNATKPTKARRFVSAAAGVADQSWLQFKAGKASGVTVSSHEFGAITLSSRANSGTFTSHVMDAQAMVTWDRGFWYGSVPAGAKVKISARTGSTATPDSTWSRWAPLTASGDRVVGDSRYIQYRVELTSSQSGNAPVLSAIGFTHNGELPGSIGEIGGGAHE